VAGQGQQGDGNLSARVACVMMQRNETNALGPWVRYHAHLFGLANIFVIDHGSDDAGVIATLAAFEAQGLRIFRLPASADYRDKGNFVTQVLRAVDASGGYDLLLPLDCDEFLALREPDGTFTAEPGALHAYLATLVGAEAVLEVKQNLVNILGVPGKFWVLPYQKVFFTHSRCGVLDHGSHADVSGRTALREATRLVYLHYHHKPYAYWAEAAREKLRPFVDVDDPAALAAFRGTGWHLVAHLVRNERDYAGMMRDGPGAAPVRGLLETFAALGIDPLFTES